MAIETVLIVRASAPGTFWIPEENKIEIIELALYVDSLEFKQLLSFMFLFSHNLASFHKVSKKELSILVVSDG